MPDARHPCNPTQLHSATLMERRSSPIYLPESNDWKIILRNESAQQLVLYNEADRRLQVQGGNDNNQETRICGECGRPWPESNNNNGGNCSSSSSFMDRNYFRLLDISSRQHSPTLLQYTTTTRSSKSSSSSGSRSKINNSNYPPDDSTTFEHPKNLSDSSINQGYYRRFFLEDVKLGRGAGGSVFKCQHVLDGIELGVYAVKKVPVGDDHSWLNRMLREVHILENLRHENIIEYKHAWLEYNQLTPFGPPIPCLFILMQLAEGGNLEEFILNNKANLDVPLICAWFEQICHGLAHLHRCGILHRDLKPSNILLKADLDNNIKLLITDFGECTSMSDQQSTTSNRTGATGTIEFVAPELLKVDRKSGHYSYQQSKSTDIWSLGLIFYFMLTGKLPYADIDDIDILKSAMSSLKAVILPREANKLPRGFKKALGAMLQVDPGLRPTIEQVLLLIKEIDAPGVTNFNRSNHKRLSLSSSTASATTATPNSTRPTTTSTTKRPSDSIPTSRIIDENTRITLALFLICISVIPTYPTVPSLRRIVLALIFSFFALKTSRVRSAVFILITYFFLISALYFNKID